MLICIIFLSESKLCSPDWIEIGSSCYKLSINAKKTWNEARKDCRSRGSDLADLNSTKSIPPRDKKQSLWVNSVRDKKCLSLTTYSNRVSFQDCNMKQGFICKSEAGTSKGANRNARIILAILFIYFINILYFFIQVNVALRRLANSSSCNGSSYEASLAVDGIQNTCFYSGIVRVEISYY